MNLILIHLGPNLPDYIWQCAEQVRRYYKGKLHMVFEVTLINNEIIQRMNKLDVTYHPLANFENGESVCAYDKVSFMGDYGHNGFWSYTFKRLFVLEEVMRKLDLRKVIHIENDILIYSNPEDLPFDKLPQDKMYANPVGPDFTTYAYCYIPSYESIMRVNEENIKILSEGRQVLESRYIGGFVNEMLVAQEIVNRGILDILPTLPTGPASKYFDIFGSLFCGSAYGQYLAGLPGGGLGWKEKYRWVGEALISGEIDAKWDYYVRGEMVPVEHIHKCPIVVTQNGDRIPLNNIHCHSKQLEKWR